jgi:hypothetical protein
LHCGNNEKMVGPCFQTHLEFCPGCFY